MKIGILGTGHVAGLLASAWANAGHEITLGSRDPGAKRLAFPVTTLADTVRWADIVVNATPGAATLATLSTVVPGRFAGKTLIDVANAITPAFALVYPNSSLAEHLQAALPGARVVKTLNTGAMTLMADPRRIGPSTVFLSGDDAGAKREARGLLRDLGWSDDDVVDLGGVESARGPEHYMFLGFGLMRTLQSEAVNIRVVR
jgi:8-hydroxy-5-deazaflavin:NADPH oxidoreductase